MPTIFCLIILVCIWIGYEKKKSTTIQDESLETFMKQEKDANHARKQDISSLDFITIPLQSLPVQKGTDSSSNEYIDSLLAINEKPIVNLSKFSNTDLKLQYGIANFDLLSEYDENYYSLIRLLSRYGCYLYEINELDKAKQVLEYSVSIGSDIKASLLTLAKIYTDEEAEPLLNHLIDYINDTIPDRKESLVSEIEKIRYHQFFTY